MQLEHLFVQDYRNILQADLDFSPKLNCFVGMNGMGKTNLLDAVYCLSFCKSSISQTESLTIRHGAECYQLQGSYRTPMGERTVIACVSKSKSKQMKRDGKDYQRFSDHIGYIPLVMVSPQDTELISGGSEERRRFMDIIISQYDTEYLKLLISYNKAVQQRNALLKMEVEGDGKTYIFLGKLRMSREPKGGVSLYVLPLRTRTPNDKDLRLDEPEMEHLRHGLILKKNVYDDFNKKTTYYAQLDGETNAILKVRARDVAIPSVVKDVDINMEMRETLRNGMPVQIDADGTPYTIGIDLTEPSGYRVLQGTMDDWDAAIAREWDKVHPEEIGFWLTDENGWEYQELSDSKLHIDMQYALDDDIDLDEALNKNQGASIRI